MFFYCTSDNKEVGDEEDGEEADGTKGKEGVDSKEGEGLEVPTEITSENEDIVDESVFKEMWGKLKIGKTLEKVNCLDFFIKIYNINKNKSILCNCTVFYIPFIPISGYTVGEHLLIKFGQIYYPVQVK